MDQEIIKEVFGWVAVILTATQFIPQAVKSFKTRSTKDLSWWTFAQTVVISALWILFGLWRNAPELIAANILVNVSCLVILMVKYSVEKPKINIGSMASSGKKIILILASALVVLIALAVAMPELRGPLGWITVVLNITQLVPQAIKSFKTKSTKDLSWWTFAQIFTITILWTLYGIWNGLSEVIINNVSVMVICGAILVRKYFSEKTRTG